jgi:hypothetical protein
MNKPEGLVERLQRDGFVFFRDFFPPELADRARTELLRWYALDQEDRTRRQITHTVHHGPAGETHRTASTHLLIDAYAKSPALDQMVDRILTDPASAHVLERMAGKHIKFRGYNIRLMTGKYDPAHSYPPYCAIPHEWHRDSCGEIGIGLFLTDVPEGGNGGTALLPGSHVYPYCPRWHALLSKTYYVGLVRLRGVENLARFTLFNRLLAKRLMKNAREATGVRGDFFFFYNDTWHGRWTNLHGRQSMIVLLGAFPTEFPFPDKVTPPPADVLARLPESIQRCATAEQPNNTSTDTILHWMLANRRRLWPPDLFLLAHLERRFIDAVNVPLLPFMVFAHPWRTIRFLARRGLRLCRGLYGMVQRRIDRHRAVPADPILAGQAASSSQAERRKSA